MMAGLMAELGGDGKGDRKLLSASVLVKHSAFSYAGDIIRLLSVAMNLCSQK
jgi:hypothetical protein